MTVLEIEDYTLVEEVRGRAEDFIEKIRETCDMGMHSFEGRVALDNFATLIEEAVMCELCGFEPCEHHAETLCG